jgi:hypothetical protein
MSTIAIQTMPFLSLARLLGVFAIGIAGPADLACAAIAASSGAVFSAVENDLQVQAVPVLFGE